MKKWLSRIARSKTMLAFLVIDIIGIIQLNSDFLSTVLTPSQFGWTLIIVGIIGKVLRIVTSQPLSDK
jgi:uncharacterized membrane protein HdeD (DUF308 family)